MRIPTINPKIEFPKFNGSNPRIWTKKCCRYFTLCRIPYEQKVNLAFLYMIERAENQVTSYLSVKGNVDWDDFIIDLVTRFKDSRTDNVVEEFNRLQQVGSLEEYIDEFENMKAILLQNGHVLPESYVLASFVGGLKLAIKP